MDSHPSDGMDSSERMDSHPSERMDSHPGDGRTGLHSLRRLTWWSTTALVYGAAAVAVVLLSVVEGPAVTRAITAVAVVAAAASAAWLFNQPLQPPSDTATEGAEAPRTWLRLSWPTVGGAAAAAVVALAGPQIPAAGAWSSFAPAIMASALLFVAPRRERWVIALAGVVVTAALAGVGSWLADGEVSRSLVLTGVYMATFLCFTMLIQTWIWEAARRLDHARHVAAELAVADERLRFAADLHDIQGHHLQVIALKSELASRLADRDPAAAAGQMMEVQHLARTALEDTREVVRGYRRVSLTAELANAVKVLAAAGIDCRSPDEEISAQLSEPSRHLLGLVVREATTNVLRHSRAHRATLQLEVEGGSAVLEMGNDGTSPATSGSRGTGLAALAERLSAAGGALAWEADRDWFWVTARVPVAAAAALGDPTRPEVGR